MIGMGRTGCGRPAMLGLALALMAGCLGDPAVEHPAWTGVVRNDCGWAGGEAAYIRIDSVKAGCGDSLGGKALVGEHVLHLEGVPVDSLKAGRTYRDSIALCALECGPWTHYTFKVLSVSATRLQGTLEVRKEAGRRIIQAGTVDLTRCPKREIACF